MKRRRHAGIRRRGLRSGTARLGGLLVLVLIPILIPHLSCRSTAEPEPVVDGITLTLDALPLLLKADSTGTEAAQIWATVLNGGRPVPDSTAVYFITSLGTVTPEALTRDGLARATFTAGPTAGVAAVVGQVKAVRDTVQVTIY